MSAPELVVSGTGWASKRWYAYEGKTFPTVTTLLKALNKPALVGWAAKSVAEYAAKNYQQIYAIAAEDEAAAVDLLKGTPWRERDKAASLGARVHAIAAAGGTPNAEEKPFVDQWLKFLADTGAEVVAQELIVVNTVIGYGGTADLILKNKAAEHVLLDIKTGKTVADRDGSVYPEIRLQLNAYAHADVGLPVAIDKAAVLHIQRDGYDVHPVALDLAPMLPHILAVAQFMGLTETGGAK